MDRIKGSWQMMCRAMNGGYEGMAKALDTSVCSLRNRIFSRKGQQMSVRMAMDMQAASGTTYFAEAVAIASGGVYISLPPITQLHGVDIQEKYVELLDKVGALAREYRHATADNEICKGERRTLTAIGNDICQLVTQINEITFRLYCKQD